MSERHPYAGDVDRKHPLLELTGLPLRGRVAVTPIEGLRLARAMSNGDRRPVAFEVLVEWVGPGLPGLPPVDGPVAGSASRVVEDLELAKAIAAAAADELRLGQLPELDALADRFSGP